MATLDTTKIKQQEIVKKVHQAFFSPSYEGNRRTARSSSGETIPSSRLMAENWLSQPGEAMVPPFCLCMVGAVRAPR
jgi:hypothetical protein